MAEHLRSIGPLLSFVAIFCLVAPGVGGMFAIAFAKQLQPWMQSHGTTAIIAFAALFAITTGLAVMPTYALSFASGVFFGFAIGFPTAMVGITGGACLAYLLGMTLARPRAMRLIESNERARIVRTALVDRGFWGSILTVILLRFPPNSPFAVTNLAMSSTKVHPGSYAIGTFFGIAPRTALATYIGAQWGSMDQLHSSEAMRYKPWLVGTSIVFFLFIYWLFGRWAKRALAEKLGNARTAAPAQ